MFWNASKLIIYAWSLFTLKKGQTVTGSVKINGQAKTQGVDYRAGIEVDTDGSYTLVLWLPLSTAETVSIEAGGKK